MTRLLEKACKKASQLPAVDKNASAKRLIEELELESEKKWMQAFAESEDILERLADNALAAHKEGKTKTLDINQ